MQFEIEPWYLLLYEDLSVYITDKEAMVLHGQAKKVARIEFNKPKNLLLPGTSLASVESLSMPLVCTLSLSHFVYSHCCLWSVLF